MSDSFSKIADDIDDYEFLCKRYGEPVLHSGGSPDCYGQHARDLMKRYKDDLKIATMTAQIKEHIGEICKGR